MSKIEIYALSTIEISNYIVVDINGLLIQLTVRSKKYSLKAIKKIIEQPNLYVLGVFDTYYDQMVGMASLKVVETRMFTQDYDAGFIGDVVVDKKYRGLGLGEKLITTLVEMAKGLKVTHINLTSNPNNPERASAIKLYEKLGFKKIGELNGSNYYRLDLK